MSFTEVEDERQDPADWTVGVAAIKNKEDDRSWSCIQLTDEGSREYFTPTSSTFIMAYHHLHCEC